MSQPDNDNIEKFFKKAAQQTDIEFNEVDWDSLKKRLDDRAASQATIRNRKLKLAAFTFLGLLSLSVITYFIQTQRADIATAHTYDSISTFPSKEGNNKINQSDKDITKQSNDVVKSDSLQKAETDIDARNGNVVAVETTLSTIKKGTINSKGKSLVLSTIDQSSNKRINQTTVGDEKVSTEKTWVFTPMKAGDSTYPNDLVARKEILKQRKELELSDSIVKRDDVVRKSNSTNDSSIVLTKPDSVKKGQKLSSRDSSKNTSPSISRWSFVVAAAPDFSSLTLDKFRNAGSIFGLVAHYQVFRRWSIATGIMYSSKNYVGTGRDYRPPQGYWRAETNGVIPLEITGACKVLENPVLVQYRLVNVGKNRLTITAGMSSYYLLSESYSFQFSAPNPGATEVWNSPQTSLYWFGITNVSLAYERVINARISVGIEPYLKIPVTGMGWSSFYSTGTYLSLRYSLLKPNFKTK